jgi:hypothetical protein
MTAPLIAPLVHPRARPGGRERGRPGTARRLPVAAAPEVPVPDDVLYGFGRMDESGRVADRAMTSALGWQPGCHRGWLLRNVWRWFARASESAPAPWM